MVGGGDTAIEEATFLTKFATKVTIVHRRDAMRASKIMQEKAMKNPKIVFAWDSVVEEILGKNENGKKSVTGVRLRNVKTGSGNGAADRRRVHGDRASTEHGSVHGSAGDGSGGIPGDQGHSTKTNIPGVFAAGDVADSVYRQAITAAGSGCQAAIDAERWLESRHG